jgi:NSS family neurotransmitter:Na+ symporter
MWGAADGRVVAGTQWSSRAGFLLASVGAAVGLGNVWRFSTVVGQNGGGAYLIPYVVAAVALGVPLMVLEMSVGRALRADVVTAFRRVRATYAVLGWVVAGTLLLVLSYYLVITGWVLSFALFTAAGSDVSFAAFTGTYEPLVAFAACTLLTGGVVSVGVRGGIERVATAFVPVMAVVMVSLAAYGTTLSGFEEGLRFFVTPDFGVLTDPLLWSAAFGQVFFSLSVGQGILLTFGSYVDADTSLGRSAVVITAADVGVAMLSGLVIFPLVFSAGLEPAAGVELAFTTLPTAFETLGGSLGRVVGVAFLGALFVAALTSAVSMLEVGVASVTGATDLERGRATALLTAGVLLLGFPAALSYSALGFEALGAPYLDVLDSSVGTLGLPVTALLIAVVFARRQGEATRRGQVESRVVRSLVRYVVPPVLVAVTGVRLLGGLGSTFRRLSTPNPVSPGVRLAVTLAALAVLAAGARAWRRRRH